jgi:excinuclease ABC subunit A
MIIIKKNSYICPECNGRKYTNKVQGFKYFDLSIVDVLDMEIEKAVYFFSQTKHGPILEKLKTASNIGLGYLKIGQKTATLSGGEAQRIKLLKNFDVSKNDMVFSLDEPFQGLNNSCYAGLT